MILTQNMNINAAEDDSTDVNTVEVPTEDKVNGVTEGETIDGAEGETIDGAEGETVDGTEVETVDGTEGETVDGSETGTEGDTVDGPVEGMDESGEIPADEGMMGDMNVDGMDETFNEVGMPEAPKVKDPLLSNWLFVGGISAATLIVSIVLGILLAKRRIKKGIELYED